ncbi:carboxylesterase family protein [Saltatorellus ferox]
MRCFLPALVLAVFLVPAAAAPIGSGDAVPLREGVAVGVTREGVTAYLGIEYARAGRWEAPGPAPTWEGERLFDHYGAIAPQSSEGAPSEDCLFLNVWKPEQSENVGKPEQSENVGQPEQSERDVALPVLVWIHGGGFRGGSGALSPEPIVKRGVIVVSFNYRLGKLGFFDHATWDTSHPRNFGMLDMVAALGWVQRNIAAFGGDPDRVTIAGNSAGGMGVQLMMVAEGARGLFSGAIAQAGYGAWPFPTACCVEGVEPGEDALTPMEELRKKSAAELVGEVEAFWLPFRGSGELPEQPVHLFESGKVARVPYLTGANSYDGQHTMFGAGFTVATFLALLGDGLGTAKTLYASDWKVSEAQAAQRIFGDLRYVMSARATARAMQGVGQPGYLYYYDVPTPGLPGAPHASEFRAVFADGGSAVQSYWLNFVRTGDPNGGQLPEWEPFESGQPAWMVFRERPGKASGLLASKLDFLDGLDFVSRD